MFCLLILVSPHVIFGEHEAVLVLLVAYNISRFKGKPCDHTIEQQLFKSLFKFQAVQFALHSL